MTTLVEMRDKVRNRVQIHVSDNRLTDSHLNDFINQACEDLWAMDDWPWKEELTTSTIAAGVNQIAMASTNRAVLGVTVYPTGATNPPYTNLARKTWKWCQRYQNVNGLPRFYCEHASTIFVYPYPNVEYTYLMRHLKNRTELTGDSDVLEEAEHFDRLIVCRAGIYVADKLRDSEMAQMLQQDLRTWVQETKVDVIQHRDQHGIMVRSDWAV